MSQPIIYLAFANDKDNPLKNLEEEESGIREELRPREDDNHFIVKHDSFATRDIISRRLADFKEDLVVFHYSGHADEKGLETAGEKTLSEGIAELLGDCPKLRLVVLNGCSTREQVDLLLKEGVPAVVATYAPVKDPKAKQFGITFFHELADDFKPFKEAFDTAIGTVKTMEGSEEIQAHRSIRLRPQDELDDSKLWGLFYGEDEEALQRGLPKKVAQATDFVPNKDLVKALVKAVTAYVPRIQELEEEETREPFPDNTKEKEMAMMGALPYPLREPLRSLQAPSTDDWNNIYLSPSCDRLLLLINLHDNLLDMVAYLAVSILWDAVNNKYLEEIPAEEKERIKRFLATPSRQRSADDYFTVIRSSLNHIKGISKEKENGVLLMEEFTEQADLFEEGRPLHEACTEISKIKGQGDCRDMDHSKISFQCVEVEKQLTKMFEKLGFLARYKILSVKKIDAYKSRSQPRAMYTHHLLVNKDMSGKVEDDQLLFNEGHYESKSVLLVPKDQLKKEIENKTRMVTKYLNLTPFIIDGHAFEKDAPIAKLYLLDSLDLESIEPDKRDKLYVFRNVIQYPLTDEPLTPSRLKEEEKMKTYNFLYGQFRAFFASFIR